MGPWPLLSGRMSSLELDLLTPSSRPLQGLVLYVPAGYIMAKPLPQSNHSDHRNNSF